MLIDCLVQVWQLRESWKKRVDSVHLSRKICILGLLEVRHLQAPVTTQGWVVTEGLFLHISSIVGIMFGLYKLMYNLICSTSGECLF